MTAATTSDERWRLGYRPALDGLRGVAVLLVIAQHAEVPLMERAGGVGVTMFFVLSGFLITSILLDEHERTGRTDLVRFLFRRAKRLLPALIAFLASMAVLGVATGQLVLPTLLYYTNWIFALDGPVRPMVHVWSLSIEEQFYAVWPLAFIVFIRRPRRAFLIVLGLCIVASAGGRIISTLSGEPYWWQFFATHLRADALLAGCALALGFSRMPYRPSRMTVGLAIAALVVASVPVSRALHTTVGIPLAIAGSIVLISIAAQREGRILSWRPLVYVGSISYGLYLWHWPFVWSGLEGGVAPWQMLALVIAALWVAAVSHRFIERPFLKSARPFARRSFAEPPDALKRSRPDCVSPTGARAQ
jgi:peptidoglycan/LPS O-acetylase OafA/YrhL